MTRPTHPSGYPLADDAPAFVAPPLDLGKAVEAAKDGAVEDAVAFMLSVPIIEKPREARDDSETTTPESTLDTGKSKFNNSPQSSRVPQVFGEDTLVDAPAIHVDRDVDSESTYERDPYKQAGEQTVRSDRQALLGSLASLMPTPSTPIDDGPDLDVDRPPGQRVMLGRARAIRFRLALLEAWPEDGSKAGAIDEALDLLLHPALIVCFADGSTPTAALLRSLGAELRASHPEITRATLRDAGAAACARITLLGTRKAAEYVRARFADFPLKLRRAALVQAEKYVSPGPKQVALELVRSALA